MQNKKVFVIGYNKTGTTSFHNLFLANELRSQHGKPWDVENYDCFSDHGQMGNFKEMDKRFKDAIFILNIRKLKSWMISRFMHGQKYPKSWSYPPSCMLALNWIDRRESYHRAVLKYFESRPNKLIIVSIDEPAWTYYVAMELNLHKKYYDIRANVTGDKNQSSRDEIEAIVDQSLRIRGYTESESNSILLRDNKLSEKYFKIYRNNKLPTGFEPVRS